MKSAQPKPLVKTRTKTPKTVRAPRKRHEAKKIVRSTRRLHKKLLLHPATIFFLLCVGIYIVNFTYRAAADSYVVRAKVAAPFITTGASFSQPNDGATFSTNVITVRGGCAPSSYVTLERNGIMSGVAPCGAGNTFEILTSLYPGLNTLKIQDFNITDDPGPVTAPINVTYTPPVAPSVEKSSPGTSVPTSVSNETSTADLPILTSSFVYHTFIVNTPATWDIGLTGGSPLYNLDISWGDSTSSEKILTKPQTFGISNTYAAAGSYVVRLKVTDKFKTSSVLQLMAIVQPPHSTSIVGTSDNRSDGGFASIVATALPLLFKHWIGIAWASYLIIGLMIISFWLGEQQQIAQLVDHTVGSSRGRHPKRR
jgi:hypothetical protein